VRVSAAGQQGRGTYITTLSAEDIAARAAAAAHSKHKADVGAAKMVRPRDHTSWRVLLNAACVPPSTGGRANPWCLLVHAEASLSLTCVPSDDLTHHVLLLTRFR